MSDLVKMVEMSDRIHKFRDQAYKSLEYWRTERDTSFEEHGLNKEQVYKEGEFDKLPYEIMLAIHYVDCWGSAIKTFNSFFGEESEPVEVQTEVNIDIPKFLIGIPGKYIRLIIIPANDMKWGMRLSNSVKRLQWYTHSEAKEIMVYVRNLGGSIYFTKDTEHTDTTLYYADVNLNMRATLIMDAVDKPKKRTFINWIVDKWTK